MDQSQYSEDLEVAHTFKITSPEDQSKHDPNSPADILQRARILRSEVECLYEHVKQEREQLHITSFLNHVRSELSILESRAGSGKLYEPGGLSGTNLLYLEKVWHAAKRCKGVVGFCRRMYWVPPPRGRYKKNSEVRGERYTQKEKRANSILVDVVAEEGARWIKVSTVTAKRLMYEMAEKGLGSDDLLEMQDENELFFDNFIEDDDKLSIIRIAEDLKKASLATRVKYKHPRVELVLPRLSSDAGDGLNTILERIRGMDVEIDCDNTLSNTPFDLSLHNGLVKGQRQMSETLNVDCTILLALVSDISHTKHLDEPWFNQDTQRQVEGEDQQNLLPSIIYPVLLSHRLVCTSSAADRMREIIEFVATPSERRRASILMGDDAGQTLQQRLREWDELSCHEVPGSLQFPAKTIDPEESQTELSPIQQAVIKKLTQIRSSQVTISGLMYGWITKQTTLTSNAVAVKTLNKVFDEQPAGQETEGPDIWLCPVPRSLAGKEKEKGPVNLRPSVS
ncbi:MAG: hypothetical protein M1821_000198 [Bathelium mastoideum]|nr:MAG: hypothetical protein M1821_000198 [Bathelium mastoideum]KAI9687765.1 MAG: hypothetical protein M1822_001845 [Bathelium mastoideum]